MIAESPQNTDVTKLINKTDIVFGVVVSMIILGVMLYVIDATEEDLKTHPEVTMVGPPGIQTDWLHVGIMGILTFLVAITLSLVFQTPRGGVKK